MPDHKDEDAPISSGTTIPSGPIIASRNWNVEEEPDSPIRWIAKCGNIEIPAMDNTHARILANALEVADIEHGGSVRSDRLARLRVWVILFFFFLAIRIYESSKRE